MSVAGVRRAYLRNRAPILQAMHRKYAIDYAWTLDTDGYFPAPIAMEDNPLVKM